MELITFWIYATRRLAGISAFVRLRLQTPYFDGRVTHNVPRRRSREAAVIVNSFECNSVDHMRVQRHRSRTSSAQSRPFAWLALPTLAPSSGVVGVRWSVYGGRSDMRCPSLHPALPVRMPDLGAAAVSPDPSASPPSRGARALTRMRDPQSWMDALKSAVCSPPALCGGWGWRTCQVASALVVL